VSVRQNRLRVQACLGLRERPVQAAGSNLSGFLHNANIYMRHRVM
jgi:hypothetical protein